MTATLNRGSIFTWVPFVSTAPGYGLRDPRFCRILTLVVSPYSRLAPLPGCLWVGAFSFTYPAHVQHLPPLHTVRPDFHSTATRASIAAASFPRRYVATGRFFNPRLLVDVPFFRSWHSQPPFVIVAGTAGVFRRYRFATPLQKESTRIGVQTRYMLTSRRWNIRHRPALLSAV